jgi:hypothetical protein
MHIGYLWKSQRERHHYQEQDVGRWIILRWTTERQDGLVWTGLIWLMEGTCDNGNESLGSKHPRKFLSSCTTSKLSQLHKVSLLFQLEVYRT